MTTKRSIIDRYDGPTTLAIDVSAHQGVIDWSAVARSEAMLEGRSQGRPKLVIVRAADGLQTRKNSRPDPQAVRNLQGAHEAGIEHLAVYHYLRAHHDAKAQAQLVREVIAVAGVPVSFVAIDLEGRPDDPSTPDTDESHGAWWHPPGTPPVDTAEVLRAVDDMIAELEALQHKVVIYTGVSWHWYVAQQGIDVERFGRLPLWTPYYTKTGFARMPVGPQGQAWPWSTWTLWQYASTGRILGIDGPIDLNRFRGDEDQLRAWLANPVRHC